MLPFDYLIRLYFNNLREMIIYSTPPIITPFTSFPELSRKAVPVNNKSLSEIWKNCR
jgi:hypothetical protein